MKAARAAFEGPAWSEITTSARGVLMWRLAELCEKNRDILATIDSWDMGKPISVTRSIDVEEVINVFRFDLPH